MLPTPVTCALTGLSIPFRVYRHDRPVRSIEQAARERGLTPQQIVRSLVFRLEDGSFVMLLMAGPARASWPKLRRHLGVSRLTTATPDEVLQVTGYRPGGVSPFGLPQALRLLADAGLLAQPTLSLGAGLPDMGVILAGADLFRALAPEVGDFAA